MECEIFRKIAPSKVAMSTLMNLEREGSVGLFILKAAMAAEQAVSHFNYSGRVLTQAGGEKYGDYMTVETNRSFDWNAHFLCFGGAAYVLHALSSDSRHKNVLPGVHDVDFRVKVLGVSEGLVLSPDNSKEFSKNFDAVNPVAELTRRIYLAVLAYVRDNEHQVTRTARSVSGNTVELHPVRSESLEDQYVRSDNTKYFMVAVSADEREARVHVNLTASIDDTIVETDHALELIFMVGEVGYATLPQRIEWNNLNVALEDIPRLYANTLEAAYDRAFMSDHDERRDYIIGKCSQDVLRLVFVILTEMDSPGLSFLLRKQPAQTTRHPKFENLGQKGVLINNASLLDLTVHVLRKIRACTEFAALACSRCGRARVDTDARLCVLLDTIIHAPKVLGEKVSLAKRVAELKRRHESDSKLKWDVRVKLEEMNNARAMAAFRAWTFQGMVPATKTRIVDDDYEDVTVHLVVDQGVVQIDGTTMDRVQAESGGRMFSFESGGISYTVFASDMGI